MKKLLTFFVFTIVSFTLFAQAELSIRVGGIVVATATTATSPLLAPNAINYNGATSLVITLEVQNWTAPGAGTTSFTIDNGKGTTVTKVATTFGAPFNTATASFTIYQAGGGGEVPVDFGDGVSFVYDNDGLGFTNGVDIGILVSGVLPVELTHFKGNKINGGIQLDWETASEIDNDYFTIEKSEDGINFEEIFYINGAGTTDNVTTYQYLDEDPINGTNYYRLKQTDYNGTTSFSDVIAVEYSIFNPTNILLFPTIATSNIQIQLQEVSENDIVVEVFDIMGRKVKETMINAYYNDLFLNINELHTGHYIVRLTNGNSIITKRFIKS